jgi:hypothetical protein
MWIFYHPNRTVRQPKCSLSFCMWMLSDKAKTIIVTNCANKILIDWYDTGHRKNRLYARQIHLNDKCHAEFKHVSNRITVPTDLVHMVEIFAIACGTSWKSRRRSWVKNGEDVKLYLPKTSEMVYMPSIAGRRHGNVTGPPHSSLR